MKTKTKTYFKNNFSWVEEMTENSKMNVPSPLTFEVKEFPEFHGKPLSELKAHLDEQYADRLPDISMMEQFESLLPKENYIWYYFFGSQLRDRYGGWDVPYFDWDGDEWNRSASWLSGTWNSDYRVVLLGIDSDTGSLASSASLPLAEPLELAIKMCKDAGLVVYKPL